MVEEMDGDRKKILYLEKSKSLLRKGL